MSCLIAITILKHYQSYSYWNLTRFGALGKHLINILQILLHDGAREKILTKKITAEVATRTNSRVIFINRHVSAYIY